MENPVGYRFKPIDEELVDGYLRPKNGDGDTSDVDRVIKTLNLSSFDPWELPCESIIQSRDQNWYFYGRIEKKYKKGDQQIRKTKSGSWKKTGPTMKIFGRRGNRREQIGEKRVLVFRYKGSKTSWVMHEYHLSPPNPNTTYTICKVKFKGAASEIYSPPGHDISHSSITDINNNSGGLSSGSDVGQSQNLTALQGFSSESLPGEELHIPPQFSGFPHLEVETELDAMLRTLGSLSEDDFNKMLNANELSTNVSMQQDCSNHMPRKPVTGVMVDVTSDDSDSDSVTSDDSHSNSVSATTGTCDSFGSSNQGIHQITDLLESTQASPNSTIELVPITQEVSQVLGPMTEAGGHKLGQEPIKKKRDGSICKMIQSLFKKLKLCSSIWRNMISNQ